MLFGKPIKGTDNSYPGCKIFELTGSNTDQCTECYNTHYMVRGAKNLCVVSAHIINPDNTSQAINVLEMKFFDELCAVFDYDN